MIPVTPQARELKGSLGWRSHEKKCSTSRGLAWLALTDDEVERLTGELDEILEAVGVVSELDLADVPPTSHPLDLVNVWDEDVAARAAPARGRPRERARRRGRPVPGSTVAGVVDTLRLTAEEAKGLLERSELSAAELRGAYLEAIAERDGELHCFLRTTEDGRGRRRADRAQGRHLDEGRGDDRGLEDPRRLRPGVRRDRRGAREGGGPPASRQDEHGRVRDGLLDRELGLRAVAEPVGPLTRARAAPAAARRRRSPPGWRRGRSARTPAARSSSRRRSAGTSGCGRRTAASRATASSRSRRASTRSARSRRPCATSRSCTRSSPGATRSTRPSTELPEPVRLPEDDSLAGVRIGVPTELNEAEGIEPGVRDAVAKAIELAREPRRGGGGVLAPALASATGCPATTSSRRPRRRRTSRATTASATGRAPTARATRRWSSGRATRASAPSRSAGSCSARTRSRPATTTRSTARRRRCARSSSASTARRSSGSTSSLLADLADGRVPDRRARRRPARDVRERPAHDPVLPRRPARALDPVRALGGAPGRAPAHRPAVRRERALPGRPRARAGARVRHGPGEVAMRDLGAGHRARDPRPPEDAVEDVLPLPGRVRRRSRTRRPARCASRSRARCRC